MNDNYDLNRFVAAQKDTYEQALAEITSGRKRSHWMWFIFPQVDGLAFSPTSRHYSIKSVGEARAYLEHPSLGPRLLTCAAAAGGIEGRTATEIFGTPDDLKLKSCATLFDCVSPPQSIFRHLLEKYFHGERDGRTLALLGINPETGKV